MKAKEDAKNEHKNGEKKNRRFKLSLAIFLPLSLLLTADTCVIAHTHTLRHMGTQKRLRHTRAFHTFANSLKSVWVFKFLQKYFLTTFSAVFSLFYNTPHKPAIANSFGL